VGGASGDGRGDRGVIYPRGRGRGRAGLATGLGRWPACLTVLCISYFRGRGWVGNCNGPVSKPTKYRAVLGLAQRAEMAVEPGTLIGPG
jgi:hypothetical protein